MLAKECKECYSEIFKEIGSFIEVESEGNYYVLMVLTGGKDARENTYTAEMVKAIIVVIKEEKRLAAI